MECLQVPPQKYNVFLHNVLSDYKQFILEETGCDTLEEAEEKERQRIIKLNPDKEPDDIRNYPAVVVSLYGITKPRIKIPVLPLDYLDIGLENAERKISGFVREISMGLDKKFPKRSKRFPEIESMMESDRFNFGMSLSTWAFNKGDDLDVTISMIDYGTVGSDKRRYHIPAISINSSTLYGSKSLVRRNIERLEKLVTEQYDITEIRHISSYSRLQ